MRRVTNLEIQNTEELILVLSGVYSYHWALKFKIKPFFLFYSVNSCNAVHMRKLI
jgi:hypothetical protein